MPCPSYPPWLDHSNEACKPWSSSLSSFLQPPTIYSFVPNILSTRLEVHSCLNHHRPWRTTEPYQTALVTCIHPVWWHVLMPGQYPLILPPRIGFMLSSWIPTFISLASHHLFLLVITLVPTAEQWKQHGTNDVKRLLWSNSEQELTQELIFKGVKLTTHLNLIAKVKNTHICSYFFLFGRVGLNPH
jgi:hypothetical protein